MSKKLLILFLLLAMLLTSCSMEATIPENTQTVSHFFESKEIYEASVAYFDSLDFDAMVSRNDYYSVDGSEKYTGLYLQNMKDGTFSSCDDAALKALFDQTDVKLVDWIRRDDLEICAFDMCVPGKNFDYGIYYTSGDSPIYFGDPSIELEESGNGYSYEKKADYGTKFTYYTEKIEDHFYYFEIS